MAKKKNYYYVLVFTDKGPVFVTEIGDHHTAYWNREGKPLELGKYQAEDVACGLGLNFKLAYMVVMPYELETQPYRYGAGSFTWEWKKTEE